MKNNKGFTLIELVIVLIIIGLLIGFVVGGSTLIRSAQLRSTINQYSDIRNGINGYMLEKSGLPGDFTGDQNGIIEFVNGADGSDANVVTNDELTAVEALYAWVELIKFGAFNPKGGAFLSNPSLTSAGYNITSGTASAQYRNYIVGTNIPESSLPGVAWAFVYKYINGDGITVNQEYTNGLQLIQPTFADTMIGTSGRIDNMYNDSRMLYFIGIQNYEIYTNGSLTPGDAASIDQKLDDGIYNSGLVLGLDSRVVNADPTNNASKALDTDPTIAGTTVYTCYQPYGTGAAYTTAALYKAVQIPSDGIIQAVPASAYSLSTSYNTDPNATAKSCNLYFKIKPLSTDLR